ncbi:MAG: hypothetical protein Q4G68_00580 [Planctomycetia bacterium]|nr:hypothetical protein [Planctomycetia bacterium]
MKNVPLAVITLCCCLFFPGVPALAQSPGPNGLGPCDLLMDKEGANLFFLAKDGQAVMTCPVDEWSNLVTLALPFQPSQFAFFPDEKRLAIVGGLAPGYTAIVRIDHNESGTQLVLESSFVTGHSPSSVVVLDRPESSGDGAAATRPVLYIADQFRGEILLAAAETGEIIDTWPAGREPVSLKATPDGQKLVAISLLPEGRSDAFYITSAVRVFHVATGVAKRIELYNGVSNLRGLALSHDGRYAFVTGTQGNYTTVTSQVVGGWIVENILAIIDLENEQYVDMIFLDDTLLGAANPWGVATSDDGRYLTIALSGTDEILIMPMARIQKIIDRRPQGQRPGGGMYAYNYQGDGEIDFPIRVRVKLGTKGLRHLLMRGNRIYALSYFEDILLQIKVELTPPLHNWPDAYVRAEKAPHVALIQASEVPDPNAFRPVSRPLSDAHPLEGVSIGREIVQLAPRPSWTLARRGEVLFHDATYCQEHWLSCATCHPDARIDGLNWDLVNDGVGNAKNTKSMLLAHQTPPSMISGVRADAETAVRAGVTHILFGKIPEEDSAAIDEYLKTLPVVPSPWLVNGEPSEAAKRGRFLFESSRTGCASCHPEPLFTDLSLHATHSQNHNDTIAKFDTPTLVESWRTAPYLNTGKYVTIRDLLFEGKHGNFDDHLDKLTEKEQNELIEYVLSL